MNYLAIDTSGKNLTVVLEYNGKKEEYFDSSCGVNHSVSLMPVVEKLKENQNADFKKLDFIAVVVGAGSFTGIRIGVSTVKALCFAYNVKALSITSFDTIAYNIDSGKNLAVIDAKHDGFYVCGYENNNVVLQPAFINREQLIELSKQYSLVSFEEIEGFNVKIVSLLKGLEKAIAIKYKEADTNLDNIVPLYIRKSQAEEGR